MTERTVSYTIVARVNNYLAGMEQVRAATVKSVDAQVLSKKSLDELGSSMSKVGTVAVGAGALAAAGLAIVVRAASDYSAKMAQLQTLSHASAAQMQQLSDAAMTAGKAYGFSASQVADAEIELTKAGVGVKAQLGGALTGALTLAAAGQIDVSQATEIATVAMTQFGLKAADIPHLADLLSAGADKALGSVADLGDALKNGGLQAHNMGLTIDDTVGTLAAFANQGIIGAEAGTQLRSMFIQLQRPSSQAKQVLDQYGISLYTAQGNFVGVTKLAGELQSQLGGLTQANRNTALATIFGSHAIVGATALYQYGAKGIQTWINNVNASGFASVQASGKLNSLQGDVTKLSASFQTDLIKAGTGANDVLRGLVQTGGHVLDVVGSIPGPVLDVGTGLAVVTAGVGLFGGAALIAIPKIVELRAAMEDLKLTGKGLAVSFAKGGAVTLGLTALAGGISNLGATGTVNAQQLEQAAVRIRSSYKDIDKAFPSSGVFDFGGGGAKASLDTLTSFIGKANVLSANLIDGATAAITFGAAGTHLGDVFKSNEETFAATGTQLAAFAKQNYSGATSSFNDLVKQLGGGVDTAKELLDPSVMPAFRDELVTLAGNAHVAATDQNLLSIAQGKGAPAAAVAAQAQRDAAASAATQATEIAKLQGNAAAAATSVQNLANTIKGFGSTTLDAHSAERAFQQAIDDATSTVDKNKKTLDINTQAGRDNQAALEGIASAAVAAASAVETQTGDSKKAAQVVADGREAFIKQAEALGETKSAAEKYADQLGLIPRNVATVVKVTGTDAAMSTADALKEKLNSLVDGTWTVNVHLAQTGSINDSGLSSTVAARRANGGMMPNIGPKGKDSFTIAAGAGEYMFSAKSVDRAGGPSAMYRLNHAIDTGAISGYATGGEIGASEAQVARDKRAVAAAQTAYSRASKSAKTDAKDRLDTANQNLKDAQARLTQLQQDREDFVSTQSRATTANPIDPLSYVDQLRTMSRDTTYGSSARNAYDAAANKYEKSLVNLSTEADAAATKLTDLKDASTQMQSSIASAIAGGYQASNATAVSTTSGYTVRNGIRFSTTSSAPTGASLASYYTQGATDTKSFAAQLKQLAGRGVNAALLAEIAGYGVEQGAPIAAALLSATSAQLAQINSGYSAIQSNAGTAGTTVADDNYAKLIDAAQQSSDAITKQIASDGEKLRKLIAQAFGLKGYASGTFAATPGLHLVGENGPEMLSFRGGERVWTTAQTQTYLRGTNQSGASSSGQKLKVAVTGPSSVTIVDADGVLMGTFQTVASTVADQRIAADAHTDSVLLG